MQFRDIEVMQLFLLAARAAALVGADDPRQCAVALQTTALRYVAQLSQAIDDPEIQRLTLGLVDVLRLHATKSQALPTAA